MSRRSERVLGLHSVLLGARDEAGRGLWSRPRYRIRLDRAVENLAAELSKASDSHERTLRIHREILLVPYLRAAVRMHEASPRNTTLMRGCASGAATRWATHPLRLHWAGRAVRGSRFALRRLHAPRACTSAAAQAHRRRRAPCAQNGTPLPIPTSTASRRRVSRDERDIRERLGSTVSRVVRDE